MTRSNIRKPDPKHKVRILGTLPDGTLFECFTWDISEGGFFIELTEDSIPSGLKLNKELHCFIEYALDDMIECDGRVARIQLDGASGRNGFSIEIISIKPADQIRLNAFVSKL